ncbi:hypothetical protein CEQ90_12460 [Lewinellaceae bacterium SD302]|nr:hypothetical protein CEQ90_12460 [Lewinellaceae bacterium SD302]
MIAVLSPAKTLDFSPTESPSTQPRLLDKSEVLINKLSKQSAANIQELMHVSEKLAVLNRDRFRAFETPFTPENAKPSIHAFKGDVYQGLAAEDFSEADIDFAQDRLRILSGLYGLLRPRDLMQAYRLEMGTKLGIQRKKNLYEFWGSDITDLLRADIKSTRSQHLVNLASVEYFKSIQPEELGVPVVNIYFKEDRGGKLKIITFNAKKARGGMARLIVKNRLNNVEELKELDVHGYQFEASLSSDLDYVFVK